MNSTFNTKLLALAFVLTVALPLWVGCNQVKDEPSSEQPAAAAPESEPAAVEVPESKPAAADDLSVTDAPAESSLPGADGQIKVLRPEDSFDQVVNSAAVVVIDFNAEWCGPCKKLGPYLERMAKNFQKDNVSFFSANVDDLPDLTKELGVSSIPDVRIYKDGKPAGQNIGCEPLELTSKLESVIK